MGSAASGAKVSFRNISKRFGGAVAVDGVNLDVAAGEFVTLLGPSGSGKTSLLNILAGFITPDSGELEVGERSILDTPPNRRGFGIVFQNYAIFPHLTVFENVAFPLKMRKLDRAKVEAAVKRVLDLVGLPGMEARYAHQLSGGQQQRVGLARAIVFDPPVLLMDESLSALDKNLRQQLQHEIRALHQRLGLTVIFVTHDQEEALAMSDRIAVMDRGKIVQTGTGRELYETPKTEFVARFFGESNLFDVTVTQVTGTGVTASAGQWSLALGADCRAKLGDKLRLFLRPDRIRLSNALDAFDAAIDDATYLGETIRVRLTLRDGPSLVARWLSSGPPIRPGDRVKVAWTAADLRIF